MKSEQIEQSLESQLEMARRGRKEVKRVELTPDEDKFLFLILNKAIAAEKAGDLAKALEHYTKYKEELLEIKRKGEIRKKRRERRAERRGTVVAEKKKADWTPLIDWAEEIGIVNPKKWVKSNFVSSRLPEFVTRKSILIKPKDRSKKIVLLPNLKVTKNAQFTNLQIHELPEGLEVGNNLDIINCPLAELPDDLIVEGNIFISGNNNELIEAAKELKKKGQIKGQIRV